MPFLENVETVNCAILSQNDTGIINVDGAVIYIYYAGCMFLFCKKAILFLLFVQLRKSPGKSWSFIERPAIVLEL